MSLGPGSLPSALGDASSRANRRTSFGGGNGSGDESTTIGGGEPPKKDRRAMLEEWRKSRAATATTSSNNNNNSAAAVGISSQLQPPPPSSAPSPSRTSHYSYKKTQLSPIVASPQVDGNNNYNNGTQTYYNNNNGDNNNNDSFEQQKEEEETLPQMPKPPASAPSSTEDNTSGLSALERYRLRKQRQQQQQQQAYSGGSGGGNLMPPTPKSFGSNEHNNSSMSMINGVGGGVGTPTHGGGSSRKHPPLPPSHSSSSHGEEDVEHTMTINMGGSYLGTPSRRSKSRGSSAISLGGAQRRVRRRTSLAPSDNMQVQQSQLNNNNPMNELQQQPVGRKSKPLLPPSYPGSNERSLDNNNTTAKFEVDEQPPQPPQPSLQAQPHSSERSNELVIEQQQQLAQYQQQHPTPTATTTSTFSQESVESIDSAALKSRLQAMQRRIDNLEREKFELSMSKAPLEARIRQKEDAWVKERERLCAEIENYQLSSKDVDERYRELEMKNEALEEQNKSLRLEARASASNSNNGGGGSAGSGYYDDGGAKDSWSERLKSNNEIKDLRKEIKNKDDEIKSLRIEKVSLESEVFGCQQEIETLERNYDELEKDYQELESSKSQNSEAEIQLQVLTTEHTAMTAQLNATCADLEEMKTRHKADLKSKEDAWKERESQLLFEMSVLKSRAGKSAEGQGDDDDDNDEASEMDPAILKARIEERDRRITELEEQLLSGEQLRRALHNRIQELRGNIRVYVRTRPFLPNDGAARGQMSIDFQPDGESLSIQGKHVGESHAFKFDKVFAPSTGQDMVFDEVSEFVQSALDGYNVCLFSYGQTGKLFPFFFCLCCAC